jgi:hypothetical protein
LRTAPPTGEAAKLTDDVTLDYVDYELYHGIGPEDFIKQFSIFTL